MINREVKENSLLRLRKVEGQVKGITKMVNDEKYCVNIINQITAAQRALEQVALGILKRHVESCVSDAVKEGKGSRKIDELMETINKFVK